MRLRLLAPSALFFLSVFAGAAHALPERPILEISGSRVQAFPVAIAPAGGDAASGKTVVDVLAADLDRSGMFRVLDPASFLATGREKTIDFSRWTAVGAQALVQATFSVAGDQITGEFRLYDTTRAAQLLHGTYSASRAGIRQIAHRFGDDLIKSLTQEPGVFQTKIAYVREVSGGKQLMVADADGYEARALSGVGIHLLPAWSQDSRTVAFSTFAKEGSGAQLVAVDVSSLAQRPLVTTGDFATGIAFAPDGKRFAYSSGQGGQTEMYLSEGSARRKLTSQRGIEVSPSWSPDGKRIAFVSDRAGSPQIYTMAADGSDVRRMTFQGTYNVDPSWSPRGDLIAFSGRDEARRFDIYVLQVATGKIQRLTQNEGTNERPSFAPNGRQLLYCSSRSGRKQLWTMGIDGGNQRQLTNERLGASDPAWGPLR